MMKKGFVEFETDKGKRILIELLTRYDAEELASKYCFVEDALKKKNCKLVIVEEINQND